MKGAACLYGWRGESLDKVSELLNNVTYQQQVLTLAMSSYSIGQAFLL